MRYHTLVDDAPERAETTVACPACGRLTGADMLQPTALLPPAAVAGLRDPAAPYFCDACRMALLWRGLLEPIAYAEAHGADLQDQAVLMDAIRTDTAAPGRATMLTAWPLTDAIAVDVAVLVEDVPPRACDQPMEEY